MDVSGPAVDKVDWRERRNETDVLEGTEMSDRETCWLVIPDSIAFPMLSCIPALRWCLSGPIDVPSIQNFKIRNSIEAEKNTVVYVN